MFSFFKNNRGSVTVFVTLLLIPSILVTGTAVDLSRIHTARSIVQDANQLAANSLLTQYEAMVQDIYGLYGIMEDDPILGEMLDEYIKVSIFGEDTKPKGMGTFELFSGSVANPVSVEWIENKNLSNSDVLRRQIEEYAKFRAPVIIIDEILNRIDAFKKIKEDSEVIKDKIEIDKQIGSLDKIYSEIYDIINKINEFEDDENKIYKDINIYMKNINGQLKYLEETITEYNNIDPDDFDSDERKAELEKKYRDITDNIKILITGGNISNKWNDGYESYDNPNEFWKEGYWSNSTRIKGLDDKIKEQKSTLNPYFELLDELNEKAIKADNMKSKLKEELNNFKSRLDEGKCSETLVKGIKEEKNSVSNKSILEEYELLLGYDISPMVQAFSSENKQHIQETIDIIDRVVYGKINNDNIFDLKNSISRKSLKTIRDFYSIDGEYSKSPKLSIMASLSENGFSYKVLKKFKVFQDSKFNSTKNKDFYELLVKLNSNDNTQLKKDAEEITSETMQEAKNKLKKLTLTPDGAKYYKASNEADISFLSDDKWKDSDAGISNISSSMDSSIIKKLGDFTNDISNKILLLTYDTEMFSDFTTEEDTLTMSGIPMNTDVNYFFQSELEYLYNGNSNSARSNIASVTRMLFLVRFVFNYTSTFTIKTVNTEITTLSAVGGNLAFIVRELLRVAYATGETAIDLNNLLSKPSKSVPIFKTEQSWSFGISSGLKETIEKSVDSPSDSSKDIDLVYKDYLRIFLLFVNSDDLANRTADLISWNITNKKNDIQADEDKMSGTEIFDMSKLHTDFMITSTVDMRMLFLSMPFAQKGANGVIPPKKLPISVTDYRGY